MAEDFNCTQYRSVRFSSGARDVKNLAKSIPPSGRTAKNPIPTPKGPPKPRNVRRRKVASEDTDSDGYDSGSDKSSQRDMDANAENEVLFHLLIPFPTY